MNILFVTHSLHLAGAEMSLLRLLRYLSKCPDVNVAVIAISGGVLMEEYSKLAPISVVGPTCDGFGDLKCKIDSFLTQIDMKPDLVLGNTIISPVVYPSLRYLGVPIISRVAELKDSALQYLNAELLSFMLRYTDVYVAVAEPVKRMLIDTFDIPAKSIKCISGVIEGESSSNPASRQALFKEFAFPENARILWGCGTIGKRKGIDVFYELAIRLNRTNSDVRAVWCGMPEDTYRHWLEKMLDGPVTFLGNIDQPYRLMMPGDVFALTSLEDPFPLVALEAGERGLPLIGFEGSGGMVDVIKKTGGRLAPPGDAVAFAEHARELFDTPDLAASIGAKTRQLVLGEYTIEKAGPRWVSLFKAVISQYGKG